jgi:hypothetical protein
MVQEDGTLKLRLEFRARRRVAGAELGKEDECGARFINSVDFTKFW